MQQHYKVMITARTCSRKHDVLIPVNFKQVHLTYHVPEDSQAPTLPANFILYQEPQFRARNSHSTPQNAHVLCSEAWLSSTTLHAVGAPPTVQQQQLQHLGRSTGITKLNHYCPSTAGLGRHRPPHSWAAELWCDTPRRECGLSHRNNGWEAFTAFELQLYHICLNGMLFLV